MKNKVLEMLKNAEGYLSGEEISSSLGVSRTAVWKHINTLRKHGYEIDSKTNKGYRLLDTPDKFEQNVFYEFLKTESLGRKLVQYEQAGSTNEELKKLAASGAADGTVVLCEEQTSGKGRLGRGWSSERYSGIYFSFLTYPDISPMKVPFVTLVTGLCVCKAIRSVTGAEAMIKWPNDIIVNNKKLCGILTEMTAEAEKINFVVTGVGVNVNNKSFPEEIKHKATSIFIETGRIFQREKLMAQILNLCEESLNAFFAKNEFAFDEYENYCASLNRTVLLDGKEGRAVGIGESGELLVLIDGEKTRVFSGEVIVQGIY